MTPKRLQRNYPIRPAPPRETSRLGVAGLFITSPTAAVPAKRRGPQITLACDACRVRKTKCDGRRPCEACKVKSSQCHYDKEGREKNKTSVLRSQIAELRAIVQRLSDASDEEAAEIKRRLRESPDFSRVAKDYCASSRSSSTDPDIEMPMTPESMSPCSQSSQRLPSIDFLSAEKIGSKEEFRMPTRLELFKIARQRAMLDTVTIDHDDDNGELSFSISIPRASSFPTSFQQIPLVRKPNEDMMQSNYRLQSFPSAPFLSAHLRQPGRISGPCTSMLLCHWLSYHAFLSPYIQPTEFINTFDIGLPETCGQNLLQDSVLALASLYLPRVSSDERGESMRITSHLVAEVEQGWRSQRGFATLSNIQTLLAQYEFEKLSGRDRIGWHSLSIAIDMSQDIGLHSMHGGSQMHHSESDAFTAWGIYNQQAIESLIYCKPPQILRCWTERPHKIFPSAITDSWRAFQLSEEVFNSSFWDHREALCNLADIIVDATSVLYGDQVDGFEIPSSVIIAQTQHSRYRLNQWRQQLPDILALPGNETPHNLYLHMLYYTTMIALHRPYVEDPGIALTEPRDVIDHSRNVTIEAARSIVRLGVISVQRYSADFSPGPMIALVASAAFTLVKDLGDDASRYDLMCAQRILQLQSERFALAAGASRAIILLARSYAPPDSSGAIELENSLQESLALSDSSRLPYGATSGARRLSDGLHSSLPTFVSQQKGSRHPMRPGTREIQRRAGGQRLTELLSLLEEDYFAPDRPAWEANGNF